MSTVGDRVKEARIHNNLTQEELAKRVGYASGRSAINKIELGKAYPSQKYIVALAEVLGVSANWLLGTEEEKKEDALERAFNERPEMRALFSVAENCTADEIEQAIKIIEALKR